MDDKKLEQLEKDLEKKFGRTLWRNFYHWFMAKKEMVERILFWGWAMRHSVDFDAHTMYAMFYYKLDRLYKCFRDYPSCVWDSDINSTQMRKLRIARELARRLMEDDYRVQADKVEEIFGRLDMVFGPKVPGKCTVSCDFVMDKVRDNARLNEFALRVHSKAHVEDNAMREREKKYLFKLLETYCDRWWD